MPLTHRFFLSRRASSTQGMIEKSKKKLKESFVTEDDISNLLQRYTAATVLSLLREVAQFNGVKIDWNALVQKTSTGISNAREYQMLWRHLAYRHALIDKVEHGAQPLDDDSDLECELEAFPAATTEDLKEAKVCTKIMMASGLSSEPGHPTTINFESPLGISMPGERSTGAALENSQMSSMRRMNNTVTVSVQKQPQSALASDEGSDRNVQGSGTSKSRKRRRLWSEEEEKLLKKGVDKYGEGNWATLAKLEFKGEKTAAQLSQDLFLAFSSPIGLDQNHERWSVIRKKHSNSVRQNSGSGQLSEAQEAFRAAVNYALPMKRRIINAMGGRTSNNTSINSVPPSTTEALPGQNQSHLSSNMSKTVSVGSPEFTAKPQLNMKTMTSNLSADPVTAAAVAAGARIVSQADATALLKPQANSTVHIMRTGVSSMKPNASVGALTHSEAHHGVRFTSIGSGATMISSGQTEMSRHAMSRTPTLKPQHNQATSAASVDRNHDPTNPELAAKQATDGESSSACVKLQNAQGDGGDVTANQLEGNKMSKR